MTSLNHFASSAGRLRTVLIDDETTGREALKVLLRDHCPDIIVVGEAPSIRKARDLSRDIDLMFLDIELPDGTGFDLLDDLGPRTFDVILVTAYDQYGIRAVKAAATDYLLKPVIPEELCAAVERVLWRHKERRSGDRTPAATFSSVPPVQVLQRLALPNAEGLSIVEVADIVRCQAHSNYTEFHLVDGRKMMISRSMGEYEQFLTASGFFRVHKSHIINMCHVRNYVRGKGGYVVMTDGSHVDVSVRRKEAFLNLLLL